MHKKKIKAGRPRGPSLLIPLFYDGDCYAVSLPVGEDYKRIGPNPAGRNKFLSLEQESVEVVEIESDGVILRYYNPKAILC
jgi:hypothetical protein